ncbi:tyrosine-protein phosphatase [Intrasporangium sp.]|uniref:tyrosine-protein phosphatase n=1 Tax=Intrasporangium sp. TaxID=1925024 RepID=UPI003221EE7D
MVQPNWIDLTGVVNMRDVGGMVTEAGDVVQEHRLLRSDNLQDLPPRSVRVLLEQYHLTDVVDLRTFVEVAKEGDGPLVRVPRVHLHHFTLYREGSDESGIPAAEKALPWETDKRRARADARNGHHHPSHDEFWSQHYLRYLTTRPDSVLAALHAVSTSEGAAIVHCAAGKDRTGTIVGLALKLVGVGDEQVVADYAASAERVPQILERLRAKPAYAENLRDKTVAQQSPQPETMRLMLDALRARFGGVQGWLEQEGWTPADTDRMRRKLLG